MLNKKSIKNILNVKHTCIDNVTMLADTSILIEVHATKGEQCRCGICGKKSKFYDNGNEGARIWRACDWAGHRVTLVGPSCRVSCKEHGDGAKWIDECIKEYCPNANRCVDPFHVIEWAMESLDSVRVDAWREAKANAPAQPKAKRGRPKKGTPSKNTTATELKNSKMALGKAPKNLTPNQQAKVEWIVKTDSRLYRAYKLKEALRLVFYNDTVDDAKEALDAWIKWARHCRIPAFVELQKKINRHMQSILNTIEYGLTNARIEAINNKIKLSIRMAYGFRNIDNMTAMIMLRCSDIKVLLPWEKDEWFSFFCLA